MRRMNGPSAMTPLASTLSAIARQYGLDAKLLEHRLGRRWPEIVGDQVAAHTRPDAVRFRKLYLIAENSVWLQQLTFLKPSLLEKINAAAGGPILSDIVLRVGEVSGRTPQVQSTKLKGKSEESDEHDPIPESMAEAAAHAHAVSDPDLRARLTAVMAKALATLREKKAR
jgi:predicted nucleic acid-binding Zn ribbon protein